MKKTRNRTPRAAAIHRGGVQSVTIAARILNALAAAGGSVALRDLAADTGLARGKAHRYLLSLRRAGMVSQQADTSLYQLGHCDRACCTAWLEPGRRSLRSAAGFT